MPSTGRFTQEDPIKDGLNWYAYCGNNPLNFVDPSGYWAAPYTDSNGVYHGDPDYEEFFGSIAYQALSDLTESYELCKTDEERAIVAMLSNRVREIARQYGNHLYAPDLLSDDYYTLNATEKVLAIGQPLYAFQALRTGKVAADMTEKQYGTSWGIGNEADAYRHASWSALLTYETDSAFSIYWLMAHEFGNSDNLRDWKTEQGSTRYQQTVMDIINNSKGIDLGENLERTWEYRPNGYFPRKLEDDISRVVRSSISNGELIILH